MTERVRDVKVEIKGERATKELEKALGIQMAEEEEKPKERKAGGNREEGKNRVFTGFRVRRADENVAWIVGKKEKKEKEKGKEGTVFE